LAQKLTQAGYTVSWQEGLHDLYEYMDWINSCKMIITQDSLGMHLGLAFDKKILILFGPTDHKEVYTYGKARIIFPNQKCKFMPCIKPACKSGLHCMDTVDLDKVMKAVKSL
ncbi:MAG: glycosyltransferase family 9 protein, partial [Candidatus Omnitrophica bacterium]|nr:glycosyltransferase family 9 protein [Candidatus Omnitrophota bacterium]